MSSFKKYFFFISLFLFVSCANRQHTVYLSDNKKYDYQSPDIVVRADFFIGGIWQNENTYTNKLCQEKGFTKASVVINETRAFQALINGSTNGIYSPREIRIWCE